jgi:hypothetical protein
MENTKKDFADILEEENQIELKEIIEGTAEVVIEKICEAEAKLAEPAKVEVDNPVPAVKETQKAMVQDNSAYSIYFDTNRFEQAQRAANLLSKSTIVPAHYRGNVSNCLIALDMSANLGLNPLLFMQKSAIIHDKMAFEGQLVISLVNKIKPFSTPIEFEYEGETSDLKNYACTAWAISKAGQKVSYKLKYSDAIKIGNAGKNANWQNATQLMISYRAATYLVRLYAPEILLGCYTKEELEDIPQKSNKHMKMVFDESNNEVSEL